MIDCLDATYAASFVRLPNTSWSWYVGYHIIDRLLFLWHRAQCKECAHVRPQVTINEMRKTIERGDLYYETRREYVPNRALPMMLYAYWDIDRGPGSISTAVEIVVSSFCVNERFSYACKAPVTYLRTNICAIALSVRERNKRTLTVYCASGDFPLSGKYPLLRW